MNERVVAGHGTVEALMAGAPALSERDSALLRALVSGSLRWHHRLQWQLEQLLEDRRRQPAPAVAALIRLGLFQLAQTRVPDHAAVSATVEAARELGHSRTSGFVNAILRRYLRERAALDAADCTAVRFSHPQWLVDAIAADWPDCWQALLDANNARAPMWLRVNAARIGRNEYLQMLAAAGMEAVAGGGDAAIRVETPCRAGELPGFDDGLVSVQDAAAQLAAGLVGPAPGSRILDACAAPGGKTAHMLELSRGAADVLALDRDPDRLGRVASELERLGLAATLRCADALDVGSWWDGTPFDRILLDAPCSGTGVIRRHPEIKILRTPAEVTAAARTQTALLAALWPLLAPGGRMVYATCSVLSEENNGPVLRFLAEHADADCADAGSPTHFRVQTGTADMDGFYYACLDRQ